MKIKYPSLRSKNPKSKRLAQWVYTQRYKKGKLSDKQIRCLEQLPGWSWNPTADRVARKKSQLLVMARNGEPKPHRRSKLGRALLIYTNNYYTAFDIDLDTILRAISPSWFVTVKNKKNEFIGMAKRGEPKPPAKSSAGFRLSSYTRKSSPSFDREFNEQIRKLWNFRGSKDPKEWVPIAEKIAKDNGDVLPPPKWLKENGYGALYKTLTTHASLFRHINQDKKSGNKVDTWVIEAEKLANSNEGILPPVKKLIKIGFSALLTAMYKYPEKFEHIVQESEHAKPQKWVEIAEELSRKNGGALPSYAKLTQNKSYGLVGCMQRHPELFDHLEQDKKTYNRS